MKINASVAPLLAYLAMPALAQGEAKDLQLFNTTTVLGAPFPGGLDEDVETLYREANAAPDQTRSVRFRPWGWLKDDKRLRETEWAWRINVSELSMGSVDGPLNPGGANFSAGRPLESARVVNTVYDLAWPGGGDIGAAVASRGTPVCVTGLLGFYFPANVTNAYDADGANSASCAPAFGEPCVDAILRLSQADRPAGDGQSCATVRPHEWLKAPECAGSWGYAATLQGGVGYATVRLNAANDSAPADVGSLASGQGFWSARSDAFEAGEGRWLDGAVNRLHILLVTTQVSSTGGARSEPQLLCARVGTERLDESADERENEDESAGQMLSSGSGWWYVALLASMTLVV